MSSCCSTAASATDVATSVATFEPYLKQATEIHATCVATGLAASSGNRYRGMLWLRDLDIKAPADLASGKEVELREGLLYVASVQKRPTPHGQPPIPYVGLYRTLPDACGQIPIVLVQPRFEAMFLRARMRGDPTDRYFQLQLLDYCKAYQPNMIDTFPLSRPVQGSAMVTADQVEADSLEHIADPVDLRALLVKWRAFRSQLVANNKSSGGDNDNDNSNANANANANAVLVPDVSFALGHFLAGTLDQCTQGTRDSEIHYIRAVLQLIQHTQGKYGTSSSQVSDLVSEFAESLGLAVAFVIRNVLHGGDQAELPHGADVRDALSDVLDDAALLSNAVFWYECLVGLVALLPVLQEQEHFVAPFDVSVKTLAEYFQALLEVTRTSIRSTFFGLAASGSASSSEQPHALAIRDFVPGKRLELAVAAIAAGTDFKPLRFSPPLKWLIKAVPAFATGLLPDPYGLARAIMAPNLLPTWCYPQILERFVNADSQVGVLSLSPISGRTHAEEMLIEAVRGYLMWPNTAFTVILACLHMRQLPEALLFAQIQSDKLLTQARGGLGEWYTLQPDGSGAMSVYAGGDAQQGWSATGFLLVREAFAARHRESQLHAAMTQTRPGQSISILESTRRASWNSQIELTFYRATEFPPGIDPRLISCAFLLPFTAPSTDGGTDVQLGMGEHRLRGLDIAGGKLEKGEIALEAAYREGCVEELVLEGVKMRDLVFFGFEHGHELGAPRDPRFPHPSFFFVYYTVHNITEAQKQRSMQPRDANSEEAMKQTKWLTEAEAKENKWFKERKNVWAAAIAQTMTASASSAAVP